VDADDRVRDTLPVNLPYDGLVAEAYDVWLPPGGDYDDRDLYRDLVRSGSGPALELGCGNGRLLVGYVADGLDVAGVDSSADMLALCRQHAATLGVPVTLHHTDWTALELPALYATVYNPAGSFALIDDVARAHETLTCWRKLLRPGGQLVVSMGGPTGHDLDDWTWRVRRSGTRASDGVTFMVHEAARSDPARQLEHTLHRHEVWEPDGTLRTAYLRRHRLRWWTPEQLTDALRDAGFSHVSTAGPDTAFLAFARVD
jgi:SAM-dependent methyltransferase